MANKVEVRITATNAASPALRQVKTELGALGTQAKATDAAMKQSGATLASVGSKLKGAVSGILNVRTALAASGLVGIGLAASKMAADVVESENLYDVSMKQMAAAGREWSEKLQADLKLNAAEVRRSLGVWQNMLTSMGFAQKAAYGMGTALTKLSYDWASFYNMDPADTFRDLQSAIAGEVEPVRRLGIDVSETAVQTFALANGLAKAGDELTTQQKVLARYALLLQQSSNAQGDLARTIESPANQMRVFREEINRTMIEGGKTLLPGFTAGLRELNDLLPRVRASWVEMGREGQMQIAATALLLVAGGPLISGIAGAIKAVRALTIAWATMGAVSKLAIAGGIILGAEELLTLDKRKRAAETAANLRKQAEAMPHGATGTMVDDMRYEQTIKQAEAYEQLAKSKGLLETIIGGAVGLAGTAFDAAMTEGMKALEGPTDTANWDDYARTMGIATSATTGITDPLAQVKAAWEAAGASAQASGNQQAAAARQAIAALVATSKPVTVAASAVKQWESAVESTQAAIRGNESASKAMSRSYQDQQERLSALNDELQATTKHMQDLRDVQLRGMGAMDAQSRSIDRQIKQLRLQQLALYDRGGLSRTGDLRGAAKRQYEALDKQIDSLRRKDEALGIRRSLTYDEQVRQINEVLNGGKKQEVTYQQAMADAKATKDRYDKLTKSVDEQESAMKQTQKAMQAISDSGEALNDTLRVQQEQLKQAQDNYNKITKALEDAYQWLLEDSDAMRKMGPEAARAADRVDDETRRLMKALDDYAKNTHDKTQEELDGIVKDYKTAVDNILAEWQRARMGGVPVPVGRMGAAPRLEERAGGGPVYPGRPYLVGEAGPELLVPQQPGNILPFRSSGGGRVVSINQEFRIGSVGSQADVATLRREVKQAVWDALSADRDLVISQGVV